MMTSLDELTKLFGEMVMLEDQIYICRHCKRETEGFGCQYCEDEDT